jgi:hypothetical protein
MAAAVLIGPPALIAECESRSDLPATLVVQVIDELWLPLPGARVVIRERGNALIVACATADGSGFARLTLAKAAVDDVEASMVGFKTKRVKKIAIDADPGKSIPHVQVKLKVAVATDIAPRAS